MKALRTVGLLVLFALGALLLGGSGAQARSTAPLTQNIFVEVKVQGAPLTGCSAQRAGIPVEIWFTINGSPFYAAVTTDTCGYLDLYNEINGSSMYYFYKGQRWLSGSNAYYTTLCGSGCNSYIGAANIEPAGDSAGADPCGNPWGDEVVNVSDFNSLKAAFGTGCGDPGWNDRNDFTNDCAITIGDLNLLKLNYGSTAYWCTIACGCPPDKVTVVNSPAGPANYSQPPKRR